MKIRTDFVTNSSSSSFVIAFKNLDKIKEDLKNLNPSFEKLIKYCYDTLFEKSSVSIESKQQLDEYFMDIYGFYPNEIDEFLSSDKSSFHKDLYLEYLDKINNGFKINDYNVDYEDTTLNDILRNIVDDENIVLLREH